jgi:hypothetical protein
MWRHARTLTSRRWSLMLAGTTTATATWMTYRWSSQREPNRLTTTTTTTTTTTIQNDPISIEASSNLFTHINSIWQHTSLSPMTVHADTPVDTAPVPSDWHPPSRQVMLNRLQQSSQPNGAPFDLLIVGGGATGTGVLLDAALRGLNVALVEKDDFSSG